MEDRRGGARRLAGRKSEQVDLPDGFQVKFKIRKTGVSKGMKQRYFVTPSGTALKSKRELDVYLEDMRQARKKAWAPAPAGRKVQQVDLPDGFQVKSKIRQTGVRKGMKDKYFVTPSGVVLKSKKELGVYLDIWKKEFFP